MQTNVYIDGFNLYYGALKDTAYKWLNPQALVQALLPTASIGRVRYFAARVMARPEDLDAPTRQQIYWRALRTLPELEITEGRLRKRNGWYSLYPPKYPEGAGPGTKPLMERVSRIEEKGTDVNIATYLLLDCFKGEYEQAVVISNDSDLALALRTVRDEFNKRVVVINPVRSAVRGTVEMRRASTEMVDHISPELLEANQFPQQMTDSRGMFTKPRGWQE